MDLQGQKVSDYTFEYRRILIKETKCGDGDGDLCYAVIIHFGAEVATLNPIHLHKYFIFRSPPYTHTPTCLHGHIPLNVRLKRSKPRPATSCLILRQFITHCESLIHTLVDRHILNPCRLKSSIFLYIFSFQPSLSLFKLISPRSVKQNACMAMKCKFIHSGTLIDNDICLKLLINNNRTYILH